MTGKEDSPVYGIKFAAIQNDSAYLMYPARWFPVNDYTVDRFTADLAYHRARRVSGVVSSGLDKSQNRARRPSHFPVHQALFSGQHRGGQGDPVKVNSEGVNNVPLFPPEAESWRSAYGDETGKVMSFLTSLYGLAPQANLTLVETEDGTPNGYSAPGLIFLSPRGIGNQVASRLLANQLARQWWETLVSPVNRNHLWLENGNARYAELLWDEHANGPAALEQDLHDTYVEAMTVDNPPLIQAGRLEDYSPEYWAAHRGQRRGDAEHAAQRDGRRQFHQADVKAFRRSTAGNR